MSVKMTIFKCEKLLDQAVYESFKKPIQVIFNNK